MKTAQSIEHRLNRRITMQLPVTVQFFSDRGKNSARTVTRNLGFGGACIESAALQIQEGTMVHLRLETPSESFLIIDALVVRSDGARAGLMFAYYDNDVFKQLTALLGPGVH